MSSAFDTRPSLLLRIRRADDAFAWCEFFEIYAPLVHSYARHRGLQDADAADVTQDVMQTVANKAGQFDYDPARGSFRGWLFTVTRNKLRDFVDRRGRQAVATGDTNVQAMLQQLEGDESDERIWNHHHQWRLFLWAAEQVRVDFRRSTWEAFWQVTVDERPARAVAEQLNLSVGAVHIAKSRVLARIKEILLAVEQVAGDA